MSIFNSIHPERAAKTIYAIASAFRDGKVTTRDNIERLHEENERTFVADVDIETNEEDVFNWYLENPESNDRTFHVYFGEITHEDTISVTLHTDVENTVEEQSLETSNNFVGSEVDSNANSNLLTSFDSLDTHFTQRYIGDGTQAIFNGYRISIAPGESIVLEVGNEGGSNFVGARVSWSENMTVEVE